MSVIYNQNTNSFVKELNRIQRKKHSNGTRLYNGDTSKFEPIEENREHFINTLMPMVMKLAKFHASKYNNKIEYEDCISAGLYGATIATDVYIKRSKEKVQDAKLSTFAHFYITKYIKEYCRNNMTILSSGPTKVREATECFLYEGNDTSTDSENGTLEFFETSGEVNLMHEDTENKEKTIHDLVSSIVKTLSSQQRQVIELSFGIGGEQPLNERKIAKTLKLHTNEVKTIITDTLNMLKTTFNSTTIQHMIYTEL